MLTDDPNHPGLKRGPDIAPGPQNDVYLVLSAEERAKGFVRPLRRAYRHVGLKPKHPLRDLTAEELELWKHAGYVKFEVYPPGYKGTATGRFWTQEELDTRGCGTETRMGLALCETYARNPNFYGFTYCCQCQRHPPVKEFVWVEDGQTVGE